MATPFESNVPFDCPTLQHLNVNPFVIETAYPVEEAKKWLAAFVGSIVNEDLDLMIPLFHEHGFWKDILTLTWDMRTIRGHSLIKQLLEARLTATGLSGFYLLEDAVQGPTLIRSISDLVFIRFCFKFETKHGSGTAVAFLIPTEDGTWKAWSLLTRLGSLKAFPERICALRSRHLHRQNWEERRRREVDLDDGDPTVLVIGAGHCGLQVAARLTHLGVRTLVVDRNQRVGDNWRMRYKTLCLQDPIWANRMPYLDFPETWPVYPSSSEMGDWLEFYATALDLNVWVSSTIMSTSFSELTRTWQVSVNRDGEMRTMTVNHLIFATGFGGGFPNMPDTPGKELYHGSILHSNQFTSATKYEGKKAIVVGACSSAHDIALDLCLHGCDVTMIQRSPTYVMSQEALELKLGERYNDHFPIEFADTLGSALPFPTLRYLEKASAAQVANGIDKALLDDLAKAGFRTYLGRGDSGLLPLIFERGGGTYIDTGASREIINGTIKVRSSCAIRRFKERGVELHDETVLEGDLVVFATGFGDIHSSIEDVCGPDVVARVGNVWGLDAEGEMQGVWRRTGHPRLWITMSGIARSRPHSLHLALRTSVSLGEPRRVWELRSISEIKAIEEGIVQDTEISTRISWASRG